MAKIWPFSDVWINKWVHKYSWPLLDVQNKNMSSDIWKWCFESKVWPFLDGHFQMAIFRWLEGKIGNWKYWNSDVQTKNEFLDISKWSFEAKIWIFSDFWYLDEKMCPQTFQKCSLSLFLGHFQMTRWKYRSLNISWLFSCVWTKKSSSYI